MSSPAASAAEDRPRRRLDTQMWFWVIVAIAAGIVFGLAAPDTAEKAKWLGDAFIQVIQAITGPVIFVTAVVGSASTGSLAKAGGLALKALAHFLGMTVIAFGLGLLAGNPDPAGQRLRGRAGRGGPGRRGGRDRRGGRIGRRRCRACSRSSRPRARRARPSAWSSRRATGSTSTGPASTSLGALFIVQAAGETLSLGEQIALAALMIPTSKGAAGITGAGLVTLVASLQAFGGTFSTPEAIAVGIALVGWHRPDHARAGPHVGEATDRALRGEEIDHRRVGGGRFEREREAEPANA